MKRKSINKICSAFVTSVVLLLGSAGANTTLAEGISVRYESMGVPTINSSFKAYEDYGCISDSASSQYNYLRNWCWVDYEGFVRANGEPDLGITDNYYCVAMGSYYGTEIGTKYRVTTDTGNVIYCVLTDQKANCDTNGTNQYGTNCNDVLEFIVNTYPYTDTNRKQYLCNSEFYLLNPTVQLYGSANVYMPLNGNIVSIERIIFE